MIEQKFKIVLQIVWNNKRLFPNINFYLAYAFLLCGIDVKLFTVISCISRFPGWSAHILEERPLNKLIRPKGTSNSTKQRTFIPRSERSIQAAL
jgi:2-methylcitrate synthase